ncbi:AbrB/MazE/SpoVT family DNA-binding domain-containing protein [Jeotgalibacillus proteolyticus]|uniref:AbrB/MazE/SpoVT family DNA-binding domain-containing protein n=1 Tax=Jeotgalibacillus proteolyticus TaxID=2082395 RepID=UPI0026C96E97
MSVNAMMGREKRHTRRLSQVGNSLSTVIPKEIVVEMQMNKGDEMEIFYDEERGEIVMRKANRSIPKGIRPDVLKAMNRTITKYDNALRNLRDR